MKFFKWVNQMIEWMGSYSHDEDGEVALSIKLAHENKLLRKECLELQERNYALNRAAEALRDDRFGVAGNVPLDVNVLQCQFASLLFNCGFPHGYHPEEAIFIKRSLLQAIAAAYQLGLAKCDRAAKEVK